MIVWDIQWLKTEPSLCLFVWLFQLFIAWQQIVPNLRPSWFTHTAELLVVLTFSLQAWSPGSSVLSNTLSRWLLYRSMTVLLTVSLSLATVPLHDCSYDCVSVVSSHFERLEPKQGHGELRGLLSAEPGQTADGEPGEEPRPTDRLWANLSCGSSLLHPLPWKGCALPLGKDIVWGKGQKVRRAV